VCPLEIINQTILSSGHIIKIFIKIKIKNKNSFFKLKGLVPEDGRRRMSKKSQKDIKNSGMYIKYIYIIISMPLTRAKKFPYYMLIHDKHRALPAYNFYFGRLKRLVTIPNA